MKNGIIGTRFLLAWEKGARKSWPRGSALFCGRFFSLATVRSPRRAKGTRQCEISMSYPMAEQPKAPEPRFSNKVMLVIWAILVFWMSFVFAGTGDRAADKAREIEENLIAPCCWTQPVSQHYSEAAEEIRQGERISSKRL